MFDGIRQISMELTCHSCIFLQFFFRVELHDIFDIKFTTQVYAFCSNKNKMDSHIKAIQFAIWQYLTVRQVGRNWPKTLKFDRKTPCSYSWTAFEASHCTFEVGRGPFLYQVPYPGRKMSIRDASSQFENRDIAYHCQFGFPWLNVVEYFFASWDRLLL